MNKQKLPILIYIDYSNVVNRSEKIYFTNETESSSVAVSFEFIICLLVSAKEVD